MQKLFFLLVILELLTCPFARAENETNPASRWILHGVVRDGQNGENLTGATVYVAELKTGTVTDLYGNYSLTLPEGTYTIVFSFIGFEAVSKTVKVERHQKLDLELPPSQKTLKEVVVSSEKENKNIIRPEMSTVRMDMKTIQKIPALMGEVDVIKAIQMLPGVQPVSEGNNQFSVRGGAPDQNLITLDEATVYNPSHMLGFFSVFNNDAIRDAKLYKGDIPPMYGGRLASVLDVRMKEGNSKAFAVTGGLGLIASRLTVEGPLMKNRMSFMVSGRRTYLDLFTPLSSQADIRDNHLYFYDFNAKLNFRVDEKNHLYLSGYFGRDVFRDSYTNITAGNATGTLRWNHVFSKKIFGTFTAVYSDYRYLNGMPEGSTISYKWTASLKDLGVKGDLRYCLNPQNTLTGGLAVTWHRIQPGFAQGLGEQSIFGQVEMPVSNTLESGFYLGNEQKAGEHWTFKYGFRLSCFQSIGPAKVYEYNSDYNVADSAQYGNGAVYNTYFGFEPRLGVLYEINPRSSVKFSYSRTNQYLQLAQTSTTGSPFDVWFPASPNIRPQVSDQVAAGYFRNFLGNTIETSAEVYYKSMNNVIDFCDFADLMLNPQLEGEVRQGKGWSYGAELLAKLNLKKVSGWVSYTYSHTWRQIAGINGGKSYLAPYDRPHSVSVVVNYQFAKRWSVSANWIYATGSAATFPTGRAEIGGKIMPVYSDRNDCRYPDYHRLDFSVIFSAREKPGRKFFWDLNLSVYNVYNRKNAWSINFVQDKENPNVTYAEKVYLFGIVPSLTFNFHF